MTIAIQFTAKQELRALPIIITHSPGMMLPKRTYLLHRDVVEELRKKRIGFKLIGRIPV